jgi:hypothetical protein
MGIIGAMYALSAVSGPLLVSVKVCWKEDLRINTTRVVGWTIHG